MEFKREDFEKWVEQGLKVSHAANFDIDKESLLPDAPVAFAFVTESAAVAAPAHVQMKMPAMIPLPMHRFTVKANASVTSNAVHVYYKVIWSARFIKPGHLCDIFLAVPPPRTSAYLGSLGRFKIEIPDCSKPAIEPVETNQHTFDDIYFIQRSQVDGGAEVRTFIHFFVRMLPLATGAFTFRIPLSFPSYARGFRAETQEEKLQQFPISGSRRCKIKISLSAGLDESILSYLLNFPHSVTSKCEDHVNLLHKSEGPDVEWPDKPLSCTFICADRWVRRSDRLTDEVVEQPQKKLHFPSGAS